MADRRSHCGAHPEDEKLFSPAVLSAAAVDFCWLLDRAYAKPAALKLVGDRYRLTKRQRLAVGRCACGDEELSDRRRRQIDAGLLAGRTLLVDGYNVLLTVEGVIATSDSGILNRCRPWLNLTRMVVEQRVDDAWIVNFAAATDRDVLERPK